MRVVLICLDKPGHLHIRTENRPAHLEHITRSGVVELAGPFLSPAGEMTGSMIVLNVPTLSDAEEWAAGDPYSKAGLFDSVTIREWRKVIG